jgi:2-haloacid dehalogenase
VEAAHGLHLVARYAIDPGTAVFIDDNPRNVEAARSLGFIALQFADPPTLRHDLERLGLLR